MKFNLKHDSENKALSIPWAALQLSGLAGADDLALHAADGCVLLLPEAPSTVETLKTVQMLTDVNIELLMMLAKASAQARGTPDGQCEGCHWEEQCFHGKLLLCSLAEAGIDPEDNLNYTIRDSNVLLRPRVGTKTYSMMKGMDEDFRAMLESVGVSLSGLFLLLKRELERDE